MPRPSRPWFRFYVEAIWDRKLRKRPPAERWLWVVVLGVARASPDAGRLMIGDHPADLEDLVDAAALPKKIVEKGLDGFVRDGMLESDGDALVVAQWGARQFESDKTAERTAKHRSNGPRRNVPTSPPGTPPETEAEKTPTGSGARNGHREHFGALVDVFGEVTTDGGKRRYGKVARLLHQAGKTPDRVVAVGRFMLTAKDWRDAGPEGLEINFDKLERELDRRGAGAVLDPNVITRGGS